MMRVLDCEQGSPEWLRVRMGIPTASEFATVLASGKGGGVSLTRLTYMRKLAGEIITGEPMDNFVNAHMERGKAMEAAAREHYAFHHDVDPQPVGFIVNGRKGCSPDSLIGNDGMLEIKTKLPHLMIEVLESFERCPGGAFPPEHVAQCQGALWVAEREWIDIAVYWPRMPRFVKRATRDEAYIKKLADAVDAFNDELAAMVERIRRHEAPPLMSHGEMMKAVLEPLDETDHGGVPAFLDRRAPERVEMLM